MTSAAVASIAPMAFAPEHVDRGIYRAWVWRHLPSASVRSARMRAFDGFPRQVAQAGGLVPSSAASTSVRAGCSAEQPPWARRCLGHHAVSDLPVVGARRVFGHPLLLGRQFASPFTVSIHQRGFGIDLDLFDRNVFRLIQLGYSAEGARSHLQWPLGRMLLHRGDPDLAALGVADLQELRLSLDDFTTLLRVDPVRELYARSRSGKINPDPAGSYFNTAIARIHAAHVLLFNIGQINTPAAGRIDACNWGDKILPDDVPQKIRVVVERATSDCIWTPTSTAPRRYAMHGMRCGA